MKRILLFCLLLVPAMDAFANDEPLFRLTTTKDVCPEYGTVIVRQLLVNDKWRFTFTAPAGWTARLESTDKRVTFVRRDGRAGISLQLLPSIDGTTAEKRDAILAAYSGARLVDERDCFANGRTGRLYELEQASNGSKLAIRLAQIPYDGGTLQIKASIPATTPDARNEFFSLMNSLKVELAPTPKPDATANQSASARVSNSVSSP